MELARECRSLDQNGSCAETRVRCWGKCTDWQHTGRCPLRTSTVYSECLATRDWYSSYIPTQGKHVRLTNKTNTWVLLLKSITYAKARRWFQAKQQLCGPNVKWLYFGNNSRIGKIKMPYIITTFKIYRFSVQILAYIRSSQLPCEIYYPMKKLTIFSPFCPYQTIFHVIA